MICVDHKRFASWPFVDQEKVLFVPLRGPSWIDKKIMALQISVQTNVNEPQKPETKNCSILIQTTSTKKFGMRPEIPCRLIIPLFNCTMVRTRVVVLNRWSVKLNGYCI